MKTTLVVTGGVAPPVDTSTNMNTLPGGGDYSP
jgi:hypothetical protein